MNESGFRDYLRKKRRSVSTIEQCICFVREFEQFLQRCKESNELDEAEVEDLQNFLTSDERGKYSANSYLWGIGRYYEFSGNAPMRRAASRLREAGIAKKRAKEKPRRLSILHEIAIEFVNRLGQLKIENVEQLLESGRTREGREVLAQACGVPIEEVEKWVRLADLIRIVDIKSVRVGLLYQAGYDSVEKIANCDPIELRQSLMAVNNERHILRRTPTLVETTYWVQQARALPKLVED